MVFHAQADELKNYEWTGLDHWISRDSTTDTQQCIELQLCFFLQYNWGLGISTCTGYRKNGPSLWAAIGRLCWWFQQLWVWRRPPFTSIWVYQVQWRSWYRRVIPLHCRRWYLQVPWQQSRRSSLWRCQHYWGEFSSASFLVLFSFFSLCNCIPGLWAVCEWCVFWQISLSFTNIPLDQCLIAVLFFLVM